MKSELVVVLLAAGVLSAACGQKEEPVHEELRPVRSVVVGASSGSVGATYSGQVYARYESRLGFQTSGKIVARLVEVGAHVKRGQPLLRLDPAQETLHVVAAVADVDAARSRVAQNRVDLQRTEQLLSRQFASQAEVDQQRLALAQSEAQLKSALAQQQIKVNQRGYTELAADRDGVVTAISAEAGQVVSAGQADRHRGRGRRTRGAGEHPRVARRRAAQGAYAAGVRLGQPGQDLPGRVARARARHRQRDPDLLGAHRGEGCRPRADARHDRVGVRARCRRQHGHSLPLTAIHDKDGQPQVWVVDARTSRVATRAVALGAAQKDSVLIAGGLDGGETVVTAGVHMLHAGQRVKAVGGRREAAAGRAGRPRRSEVHQ